ncbi:MAG TPA: STAS domain-containing protein [Chitinophagales bacterium]|nr:STAS domain-containing protein [Chitinophagales bacterium]HRK25764.1 STAS domain-containing protein [Chitinophagales bacterium]
MKIDQNLLPNGLLLLSIDGDLDASSSMLMDEVIVDALQNQQYQILINCGRLNYISSAGLGVFVSHRDSLLQQNGALVFYNMNERVYNIFELLGLHNIFNIVPNEHDARKFFAYETN